MYNLFLAFDGTAQPIPGDEGVRLWYMESASRRRRRRQGRAYTGTENVAHASPTTPAASPSRPRPRRRAPRPTSARRCSTRSASPRASRTWPRYFNFLLADEPRARGLAVGRALGRPDAEGLAARVPAGDRGGDPRHGRLRCAQGRPAERRLHAAGRAAGLAGAPRRRRCASTLSWNAAADDIGAVAYRVYRNGAHVATTSTRAGRTARRAGDDLQLRRPRARRRREHRRCVRVGPGNHTGSTARCASLRRGAGRGG